METIRGRVAGLDVHRDRVVACVRVEERRKVRAFKQSVATTRVGVTELAEWLEAKAVSLAVLESTGVYRKPVYYGLEHRIAEVWLVNAPDADMSATNQSTAAPCPSSGALRGSQNPHG